MLDVSGVDSHIYATKALWLFAIRLLNSSVFIRVNLSVHLNLLENMY